MTSNSDCKCSVIANVNAILCRPILYCAVLSWVCLLFQMPYQSILSSLHQGSVVSSRRKDFGHDQDCFGVEFITIVLEWTVSNFSPSDQSPPRISWISIFIIPFSSRFLRQLVSSLISSSHGSPLNVHSHSHSTHSDPSLPSSHVQHPPTAPTPAQ